MDNKKNTSGCHIKNSQNSAIFFRRLTVLLSRLLFVSLEKMGTGYFFHHNDAA